MAGQRDRGFAFEQQRRSNTGRPSSQAGQTGGSTSSGRSGSSSSSAGGSSSSGMMGAAQEKAQEWASTAATTAENAWDSARHEGRELANKAEDVWDDFNSFIRRYPFAAVLGAVGVGFLLGGASQFMTSDHN